MGGLIEQKFKNTSEINSKSINYSILNRSVFVLYSKVCTFAL